ncbi:hypothetical protein BGZ80_005268, partial [Entomortierella chlamydospora]
MSLWKTARGLTALTRMPSPKTGKITAPKILKHIRAVGLQRLLMLTKCLMDWKAGRLNLRPVMHPYMDLRRLLIILTGIPETMTCYHRNQQHLNVNDQVCCQKTYIISLETAVNYIYLFERSDTDSTLLDAVGLEDWRAVTSVTIEKGIENTTIQELQRLALELSNLSHRESEELILSWDGDTNIKRVLGGLVEESFLWSSAPFNEHELLIHIFDPFLKAYICSVKGSIGRWDQAFPLSQNRKKGLDENSQVRKPAFTLKASISGIVCYLFFVEVKKVRQSAAVVQDDLEKLAGMMKDAIDDMSKQGVNIGVVEVIGLHIVGTEGRLYSMKLEAR